MKTARILWADDEDIQYEPLSETLDRHLRDLALGVEIIRAKDGNEVFRILSENQHFDLILLDLQMDNWNGVKTIRTLKAKYAGIPVLVVSKNINDALYHDDIQALVERKEISGCFLPYPVEPWVLAASEIIHSHTPVILHLSDLHFGEKHALGLTDSPKTLSVFEQLLYQTEEIGPIDMVVVSGDLTTSGKKEEFLEAEKFLKNVSEHLHLDPAKILIVPGNHDIYRTQENGCRFEKYVDFLKKFFAESKNPKEIFERYPSLYDRNSNKFDWDSSRHTADDLFAVAVFDDLKVVVACLNSVVDQPDRFEEALISHQQFHLLRKRLAKLGEVRSTYIRIAVFHHQLFVVPSLFSDGEPARLVRNPSLVIRELLSQGFDFALHGHSHYSSACTFMNYALDGKLTHRRPLAVFSTGTFSAKDKEPAQSYFHATVIGCRRKTFSDPVDAVVYPFKLRLDQPTWECGDLVEVRRHDD